MIKTLRIGCFAPAFGFSILCTGAVAQTPEVQDRPMTLYFLIDASGSMAQSMQDAELTVAKLMKGFSNTNPNTLVSRTYFSANTQSDRSACNKDIAISAAVPIPDSKPEARQFSNDSSPIGAALQSAINEAKNGPAKIYLVSDGEATESCGADACDVAVAMLPRSGVDVEFIGINPSPMASDRMGCIAAAQSRSADRGEQSSRNESVDTSTPISLSAQKECPNASPLERRWWLFSFGLIAAAACLLGFFHLRKSIALENTTRRIHSLDQSIRRGGAEAQQAIGKLRMELEKNGILLETTPNGDDENKVRKRLKRLGILIVWIIGLSAILSPLLLLTFGDPSGIVAGARRSVAQCYAWTVLDSQFSGAFAILFIAAIFFLGSQMQRHQVASQSKDIAAKEAKLAEDAQASRALNDAYEEYLLARNSLESLELVGFPADVEEDDMRIVSESAKFLAAGTKLDKSAGEALLSAETKRLKSLLSKSLRFMSNKVANFSPFVSALNPQTVDDVVRQYWDALVVAVRSGTALTQSQATRDLASALKSRNS
jgi:uncharacterized membrane protein YciS (DUF1049 family)